jgi:hypothetical protein
MHSSENKIGWQFMYENGPYTLFQYCGLMNLSETFLGCQQRKFINENTRIYWYGIGKISSFFKKTSTRGMQLP